MPLVCYSRPGLYAIYQERGAAFVPEYKDLLSCTGMNQAVDLAKRFDIDIQQKTFWEGSLKVVAQRVERYKALVANIQKVNLSKPKSDLSI